MDFGLFAALLLMLGFGLVLVYSSSFAIGLETVKFKNSSEYFVSRQMIRALLALAGFMVFVNVDYHAWGKMSSIAYLGAVIMLVVVLLVPGDTAIKGAKRWLSFGPLTFQVSDIARMALVLFIARKCDDAGTEVRSMSFFLRMVGMIGVIGVLILVEPGFSTSSIVILISLSTLFMAGVKMGHLALLGVAAVPVLAIAAVKMNHSHLRLVEFFNRHGSLENMGYQAYQSVIGLGNGGLFGVGIGKGEQKFFYLPEPHTDFVLSILGEEIGFIGLMVIFAVYAFIVYRGMKIATEAPDRMGQLMAFGFTFAIAVNMLLHTGVAVGLLPTTGVALPFISYGGMSLIFMVCSMGIVLNISSQSRYAAAPAEKPRRAGRNNTVRTSR